MRAARRQRQRAARRVPVQATVGIERIEEREQVVLVGAAAVEQDERALRLLGGRTLPHLQAQASTSPLSGPAAA